MSIERTVVDPSSGAEFPMSEAIKSDPKEIQKLRAEKKAKLARILERGMIADRLTVDLPPEVHGEWVPNDKSEIYRMKMLGFKIDDEFAVKRALHDEGDGRSIVGDTVFMTCDRETKDIIDEIRRDNFERMNGKPGATTKRQKEESEFKAQSEAIGMPVIEESASRAARKADLEAALQKVNEGVKVPAGATIIK
ncbi:MAG TPA: hypothetical protein VF944_08875 [Candidatus Bathyarchaeia archaeon]